MMRVNTAHADWWTIPNMAIVMSRPAIGAALGIFPTDSPNAAKIAGLAEDEHRDRRGCHASGGEPS